MSAKQMEVFELLSATFSSETVANWEVMVAAWNANPKVQNPYTEPKSSKSHVLLRICVRANFLIGTTLQDVRLELAKEEATRTARGMLPPHEISMASFLMTGFELEDSQCVDCLIVCLITSNECIDTFYVRKQPREKV